MSFSSDSSLKSTDFSSKQFNFDDECANSLKIENENLLKKNSSLEAQFRQAIDLANASSDLRKCLQEVTSENRALKQENLDIKNRLEIATKETEQLGERIANERQKTAEQTTMREEYAVQELKSVKIQLKNEINLLQVEVDKLNADKKQMEINAKLYDVQKQHIIQILSTIYNIKFNNINEAVDYCEVHPILTENLPQFKQENITNNDDQVNLKIERERKRRKTAEKVVFSLQEDLGKAQLEIQKLKEEKNDESFSREKINQLEEEKALVESDYKHRVLILTGKINSLKEDLEFSNKNNSKLQQEIFELKQKPRIVQQRVSYDSQSTSIHDELYETNSELLSQNSFLKDQKDKIYNELEQFKCRSGTYEKRIRELESENEQLETKLRATIQTQILPAGEGNESKLLKKDKKIAKLSNEKDDLSAIVDDLKHALNSEKQKNLELNSDLEVLSQQNKTLKMNEANLNHEIAELEDRLDNARLALTKIQQLPTNDDSLCKEALPSVSFHPMCFDSDLTHSIDVIANTPSLKAETKIQSIYKCISKHYNQILGAINDNLHDTKNDLNTTKDLFDQFINDVSLTVLQTPLSYEDYSEESHRKIIKMLNKIRQENGKMNNQTKKFSSVLDSVCDILHLSPNQIVQEASYVAQTIEKQEQKIKKYQKKQKEMKKLLCEAKKDREAKEEFFNKEKSDLNAKIRDLNTQFSNIKGKNKDLKVQINNLNAKIREVEDEKGEITRKLQTEKESTEEKLNIEKEQTTEQLMNKIQELNDLYNNTADELSEAKCTIARLTQAFESQKSLIKQLNEELNSQVEIVQSRADKEKRKSDEEKYQSIKEYKSLNSKLVESNKELQRDNTRLSKESEKYKKLVDKYKSSVSILHTQNERLEKDINAKEEEAKRALKLNEASLKAALLQSEAQYSAKLLDQKSKYEGEKRNIFSFAADKFRRFFDPNSMIDELTYQRVLTKASEAIQKYEKQDSAIRSAVGANPLQTTDSAVAEFVLDKKKI